MKLVYLWTNRHRWTGRYEAHLWDNSCRREGQSRKGRQGIAFLCSFLGSISQSLMWIYIPFSNVPNCCFISFFLGDGVLIIPTTLAVYLGKCMLTYDRVVSLSVLLLFSILSPIIYFISIFCKHSKITCIFLWSGGYDKEEKAARAYDLAALKYWGPSTTTNFPVFFWVYI